MQNNFSSADNTDDADQSLLYDYPRHLRNLRMKN